MGARTFSQMTQSRMTLCIMILIITLSVGRLFNYLLYKNGKVLMPSVSMRIVILLIVTAAFKVLLNLKNCLRFKEKTQKYNRKRV
jgi:hypothetical protein